MLMGFSAARVVHGQELIGPQQWRSTTDNFKYSLAGGKHIVVSGIFSSVCGDQEVAVGEIIKSVYPEASFTLCHQVGNFGLLERENSSILNESLKPLSKTAISAFTHAVEDAGLNSPIFFTQNDGTIIRY